MKKVPQNTGTAIIMGFVVILSEAESDITSIAVAYYFIDSIFL